MNNRNMSIEYNLLYTMQWDTIDLINVLKSIPLPILHTSCLLTTVMSTILCIYLYFMQCISCQLYICLCDRMEMNGTWEVNTYADYFYTVISIFIPYTVNHQNGHGATCVEQRKGVRYALDDNGWFWSPETEQIKGHQLRTYKYTQLNEEAGGCSQNFNHR